MKMMKAWKAWMAVFVCAGLFFAGCSSNAGTNTQTSETTSQSDESKTETDTTEENTVAKEDKQSKSLPGGQKYEVTIEVKDYGTIVFEMDEGIAPETVQNFVKLAESGFYDGLTFHRIMDGFMIQGGDPKGNGTGGSSKTIEGEFASNGFDNTLSHVRGTVSMARSSDPDSASSQFFIVHEDSTFLDGEYAAFGTVTEGMDVVDEIAKKAEPTDNNGTIEKDQQPVIESVTVQEIE